jgi:purine-binding chemotaxis protein CheW
MENKDSIVVADEAEMSADDLTELFRERARVLSEVPTQEEGGERIAALSFQLGDEVFGIELRYLLEMRQATSLRRLPGVVPHLAGVINLRGELLPVVDLRPVLGLGKSEVAAMLAGALVLSFRADKVAVAVDRARDILNFPASELKPPPMSLDPERAAFIRGEYLIEGRLITLLDAEKIFTDPRFAGESREG